VLAALLLGRGTASWLQRSGIQQARDRTARMLAEWRVLWGWQRFDKSSGSNAERASLAWVGVRSTWRSALRCSSGVLPAQGPMGRPHHTLLPNGLETGGKLTGSTARWQCGLLLPWSARLMGRGPAMSHPDGGDLRFTRVVQCDCDQAWPPDATTASEPPSPECRSGGIVTTRVSHCACLRAPQEPCRSA